MNDEHVRIAGDPVTHVVSWSSDVGGYTRCNRWFSWTRDDLRPLGHGVDTGCDCMTCLVKEERTIAFQTHQEIGMSVINVGAIDRLRLLNEE